jgi:hypothetical protein
MRGQVEKSLGAEATALRSARKPRTFVPSGSAATECRRQHLHTRRVDAVEASLICGEV